MECRQSELTGDKALRLVRDVLQKRKAEVTVLQLDTPNPIDATKKADILISATGVPQLVRGNWVKPGAVVIDVGTSAIEVCFRYCASEHFKE